MFSLFSPIILEPLETQFHYRTPHVFSFAAALRFTDPVSILDRTTCLEPDVFVSGAPTSRFVLGVRFSLSEFLGP